MPIALLKLIGYTSFALIALAGNSVLCRLALGGQIIDAASFTVIRLMSGIVILSLILLINKSLHSRTVLPTDSSEVNHKKSTGSWLAGFMLFLYAITFSYAYISLDTGTGALILFGAVQISMILVGLWSGNKLHYAEWLGIMMAFMGLVYLVIPSLSTPSMSGFILMAISGVAWAVYSLLGRASTNPIDDTAYNFLRTLPFILLCVLFTYDQVNLSTQGLWLAIISGAITSGLGYILWYMALRELSVTQAAVIQLLVPTLAALGGIIFVNELVSLRFVLSSVLVLGGILIVVTGRYFLARKG
jgi:drug/metabolite transporter (DMT)-like permease